MGSMDESEWNIKKKKKKRRNNKKKKNKFLHKATLEQTLRIWIRIESNTNSL